MLAATKLRVNGDRLNRSIEQLAQIGKLAEGGVRRIAYSTEDIAARQVVQDWMKSAGMNVRIDAAGNIIGRYAGNSEAPALATGSHIDTVTIGGHFDGVLGVLAGIEVVRTLNESNIRLQHPLEAIVFTDEENSMIGSKAISGTTSSDPETYRLSDGTPIEENLRKIGGDWSNLATAKRSSSDIAAYVELHVEQGVMLDKLGKDVGVVEGVVGLYRGTITVIGTPNHAGTTPMDMRQDALVGAAQVVLAVNDLGKNLPGQQVATVGKLNVSPNATNTVPGEVEMSLDIRDLSAANINNLIGQLQERIKAIAETTNTQITLKPFIWVEPTLAKIEIQEAIAETCTEMGLSTYSLPSRAGHDAQEIGRFTDMGMIFVPSQAGISHSVDEYTSPEQCTYGANILLHTFLRLDNLY